MMEKNMQDMPSEQREDPAPASVKTLLIVEDDADIGEALTAILQDETPYQVIHVSDGFAALKVIRTLIPQLVLLDYLLPGMDGLECLDRLRASKGMEQTPVMLMSAALPKEVQTRPDLVFLEKPFEIDTLIDLIGHLLEEHEKEGTCSTLSVCSAISANMDQSPPG
jgi:DNA-binding response OmpR family regulator